MRLYRGTRVTVPSRAAFDAADDRRKADIILAALPRLGNHWSDDEGWARSRVEDYSVWTEGDRLIVLLTVEWDGTGEQKDPAWLIEHGVSQYQPEPETPLVDGTEILVVAVDWWERDAQDPADGVWHTIPVRVRKTASDLSVVGQKHGESAGILTLYHGTRASLVPTIRAEGLRPPPGVNPFTWYMLTTSREQAERYTAGKSDAVVIEYQVPAKFIERGPERILFGTQHDVYGFAATAYAIKESLPGEYITAITPVDAPWTREGAKTVDLTEWYLPGAKALSGAEFEALCQRVLDTEAGGKVKIGFELLYAPSRNDNVAAEASWDPESKTAYIGWSVAGLNDVVALHECAHVLVQMLGMEDGDDGHGLNWVHIFDMLVRRYSGLNFIGGFNGDLPEGLDFFYDGDRLVFANLPGRPNIGSLSWDRDTHEIAFIRVADDLVRRGIATAMYRWAQENVLPDLHHSTSLTRPGRAWAEHTALPSWRDRGAVPEGDIVIKPDTGRSRNNYFEVLFYGVTEARFIRLQQAKDFVQQVYGDVQWRKVPGDTTLRQDETWGPTDEFNDARYYLVADAPRLAPNMAKTARYGSGYIARGFKIFVKSRALAQRFADDTVTAQEIVNASHSLVGGVGGWWGVLDEDFGLDDIEGYAYVEETVKIWLDPDLGSNSIGWGEVGIVMIAKRPTMPDGTPWSPGEHNPVYDPLMGNSYVKEFFDTVELVEIRYDAGWGWRTVSAPGMRVKAARSGGWMFHVTRADKVAAILANGLGAGMDEVHLWTDFARAVRYSEQFTNPAVPPAILLVKVPPGLDSSAGVNGDEHRVYRGQVFTDVTEIRRSNWEQLMPKQAGPLRLDLRFVPSRNSVTAYLPNGPAIGFLSWYTRDGESLNGNVPYTANEIQTLDVDREYRRMGVATALWEEAKRINPALHHSPLRSDRGDAWARSVTPDVAPRQWAFEPGRDSEPRRVEGALQTWYHAGDLNHAEPGVYVHLGTKEAAFDRRETYPVRGMWEVQIAPRHPLNSSSQPLTDAEVNTLTQWADLVRQWPEAERDGGKDGKSSYGLVFGDVVARTGWTSQTDALYYLNDNEGKGSISVAVLPSAIATKREVFGPQEPLFGTNDRWGNWVARLAALQTSDYEGTYGDRTHITRVQTGTIPIEAVKDLKGARGETPGAHRNRQGEDWTAFKDDIATHGILNPIFIVVDPYTAPLIYEGNHRRDAAVELGMTEVPVEIRYYGHAEKHQSLGALTTTMRTLPGRPGSLDISMVQEGTVPVSAIEHMAGQNDEVPGAHAKHSGQDWVDFVTSVEEHGITDPIVIWVTDDDGPRIAEGNNRRDAAVEIGLDEVPVKVVYYGATQPGALGSILDSVNPSGSVFVGYDPAARANATLGPSMTTYDKAWGVPADRPVTIYRGAPASQREIVPGDFVTTNRRLAQDYAGGGIVLMKTVPAADLLADDEYEGEEYIYRPGSKTASVDDYGMSHQPLLDGPSIDRLDEMFGEDVYTHPEWGYGISPEFDGPAARVLRAVRGKPEAMVTIYRALPPGHTQIETGNWVTTVLAYARQHAMQNDNPADDWPVIMASVPAKYVVTGGSDIVEWGYVGPTVNARVVSKTAASGGTIYRGLRIPLTDSLREMLAFDYTEDEQVTEWKAKGGRAALVAQTVLDTIESTGNRHSSGMGIHWSTRIEMAGVAAETSPTYPGLLVILEAQYGPDDVLPEDDDTYALSGVWGGNKIEAEVPIKPGARLRVTNVYVIDVMGVGNWVSVEDLPQINVRGDKYRAVLARPETRTASGLGKRQAGGYDRPMQTVGVDEQTKAEGVMIALVPPVVVAEAFAALEETTESLDEQHVTLIYLGTIDEVDHDALLKGVAEWAETAPPLTGWISGYGVFQNPEEHVLVALWDFPGGPAWREGLWASLRAQGVDREENHGWTPHETLAYSESPIKSLPDLPEDLPEEVVFGSVAVSYGKEWTFFPLRGQK